MTKKISVAGVARKAKQQDARERKGVPTMDSFVNFAQRLGIGADNPLSTSSYGFNPITRVRTQLEWIHRGSWLGGVAVDVVAEDMTRAGVQIKSTMKPDEVERTEEAVITMGIWPAIKETVQWSRLYGGALAVMMVDGQKPETPLRIDTVGKGQFRGLLVLDRWMVEPTLNDLVQEAGPDMGLPKFYYVTADAPAIPRMRIHHSRCIRLEGIRLPYWQRVMENLWGISVIERLYDRMVAFDSATTGAAQLVYKAYLRTMKVKNLREIVAAGGDVMNGLAAQFELMRRFQGVEGITLMDAEDDFGATEHSAFGGLADALAQFGQQLSGALQIPLVRLFGQSPAGFGSGDNDVRLYYDGIASQQKKDLKVGITKIYRMAAQSEGIKVPDGFSVTFNPLWQLSDKDKADVATTTVDAVVKACDAGLVTLAGGAKELRQSAAITGVFSNITDEDIAALEDAPPPAPGEEELPTHDHDSGVGAVADMWRLHGLHVAIENPKGSVRTGPGWQIALPEDYGYIRKTEGADGDQLDCYVGPVHISEMVFIIDQNDPDTGEFDEHKVMLGFLSAAAAKRTYAAGFTDGRALERFRALTAMPMNEFKGWLAVADLQAPCR